METFITTKVTKVGNTHCIFLPKRVLEAHAWQRGDPILITNTSKGCIVLTRLSDKDLLTLKQDAELLGKTINPNAHINTYES